MCNPRKVMIHLARSIEEAWRRTVEQTATATGKVQELARITAQIALDAEMGDLALTMLERVLAGEVEGFPAWTRDSLGHYRRNLDAVTLVYNPDTHQLSVEARLTELVSAEARAAAEASGFTVGEVAVDAVGRYYHDGWGGRTQERAVTEATAEAEQKLAAALEDLHREQNAAAFTAAEVQAQAAAQTEAQAALAAAQTAVRTALRARLDMTLANAQEQVRDLMNRAVGEAYRQALLQLVLDNGGRVLMDETTGAVMNLELELY